MKKVDLTSMASKWPSSIVSRDSIGRFTGGLVANGTMIHRDKELPRKFKRGRKVFYYVDDVIEWLARDSIEITDNTVGRLLER